MDELYFDLELAVRNMVERSITALKTV
jgi:hypothetical protein